MTAPLAITTKEPRQEGVPFQGNSGNWFVVEDGRVHPYKHDQEPSSPGQSGASSSDTISPDKTGKIESPLTPSQAQGSLKLSGKMLLRAGLGLSKKAILVIGKGLAQGAIAQSLNLWHATHAVLGASAKATQAIAKEVAVGKGFSEEQVQKLSNTLGALDASFQWGMTAAGVSTAAFAPPVAIACKALAYFPAASTAYLLGSVATSDQPPSFVLNAAYRALKKGFPGTIKGAALFAWGAIRHPLTRGAAHAMAAGHAVGQEAHKAYLALVRKWASIVKQHGGDDQDIAEVANTQSGQAREAAEIITSHWSQVLDAQRDDWLALFSVAFDDVQNVEEGCRMADEALPEMASEMKGQAQKRHLSAITKDAGRPAGQEWESSPGIWWRMEYWDGKLRPIRISKPQGGGASTDNGGASQQAAPEPDSRGKPSATDEGASSSGKVAKPRAVPGVMLEASKQGTGKEARVILADGSPAPAHIKPGMIGPGWTDVKVSQNPDSDIAVSGKDRNGKSMVVYSDAWDTKQAAAKFARTREGILLKDEMDQQVQRDRGDPAKRDLADCVWLMRDQATRPGSEADNKGTAELFGQPLTTDDILVEGEGKKQTVKLKVGDKEIPMRDKKAKAELIRRKESGEPMYDSTFWLKSHGATTLEGRHVVEMPDGVHLQFMGKESVWHNHLIADHALSKMLLERKAHAGDTGKLFNTNEKKVATYSATLDGGKFSPKDWRTQKATSLAIETINAMQMPKTGDEYKDAIMAVAERVSGVLGNDPEMALTAYIAPECFSAWRAAIA